MNKNRIAQITDDQIFYIVSLDQVMTEKSPRTGSIVTLNNINGLMICHKAGQSITFNSDNTALINTILK